MFFNTLGRRSDRQKREDQAFMQALGKIPTLQVRDGRMSMDISDIQEQVIASRKAGKVLIDR